MASQVKVMYQEVGPIELGDGPIVSQDTATGELAITWPNGRPDYFAITSDVFEYLVGQLNEARGVKNDGS